MVAVIRFEKVGLRYGHGPEVLRDITFELAAGSFYYLTGSSGAGKSSLMSLMYLAHRPSSGRVTLFERDVETTPRRDLPAMRRKIGVVFQDFRLLDHLSTFDNVALPLRVLGVAEDQIEAHVVELLTWVGLADRLADPPPTLSGGEKQRVAIARAVVARPRLLLADEPTGNVDDAVALRLLHLFEELNKLGTTIVFATHSDGLVARMPRPQLHLEDGRIAAAAGS
jgi:cell division transport system ATP-binding protein